MSRRLFFLSALSFVLYFYACKDVEPEPPMDEALFEFTGEPFEALSAYNFFTGTIADLRPDEQLLAYDLNTPLFSNYASKQRFIYLPEGTSMEYREDEIFDFPEGAFIIKTFYYWNDFNDESQGRKILETRLLHFYEGEWLAYNYIWNEEQTEATYSLLDELVQVEWTHYDGSLRSTHYAIPNQNECKGCHELSEVQVPIGPRARNLNKDFEFSSGNKNILEHWTQIGLLSGMPDILEVDKAALWNDLSLDINERARTYLDINCGHCHNSEGPANNTGLNLDPYETDSLHLGFCKPPVAAGQGSGGLDYAIVPGDPDASIMIHRLASLQLEVSMPELSRSVVHEEGLQLLRDWVEQLPGDCD